MILTWWRRRAAHSPCTHTRTHTHTPNIHTHTHTHIRHAYLLISASQQTSVKRDLLQGQKWPTLGWLADFCHKCQKRPTSGAKVTYSGLTCACPVCWPRGFLWMKWVPGGHVSTHVLMRTRVHTCPPGTDFIYRKHLYTIYLYTIYYILYTIYLYTIVYSI
jgi:hypothetical protein